MTAHDYIIDGVAVIVIGYVTPTDEELKRIVAFARKNAPTEIKSDIQIVMAHAFYVKEKRFFEIHYTTFLEAGILTPETEI